jgi:hypothetical protein
MCGLHLLPGHHHYCLLKRQSNDDIYPSIDNGLDGVAGPIIVIGLIVDNSFVFIVIGGGSSSFCLPFRGYWGGIWWIFTA